VADIEVILQTDGSIEVLNKFQPVEETEYVHWHFRNHNDEAAKVTVEFEEANYFLVAGTPSRSFSRTLDHADTIYGRSPQGRTFPKVETGRVSGLRDKYTITIYDDEDGEINSLDPEIVPIRP
jgi:hypothetical protein